MQEGFEKVLAEVKTQYEAFKKAEKDYQALMAQAIPLLSLRRKSIESANATLLSRQQRAIQPVWKLSLAIPFSEDRLVPRYVKAKDLHDREGAGKNYQSESS